MFCDDDQAFREQLDEIKRRKPLLINCHPGRDYFDLDRGVKFFKNVMKMAEEVDCEVVYRHIVRVPSMLLGQQYVFWKHCPNSIYMRRF